MQGVVGEAVLNNFRSGKVSYLRRGVTWGRQGGEQGRQGKERDGVPLPHGATQPDLLGPGKAGKVVDRRAPPTATRKSRVKALGCSPVPPG